MVTSMGHSGWNLNPTSKGAIASWVVENFVVVLLDIGKPLIPSVWVLRVVHVQDVHDPFVDDLYLAISLGVKGHELSELCIQQQIEAWTKFT